MDDSLKLFDIVVVRRDIPDRKLFKGLRGAIVECYRDGEAFEVDFSDEQGRTFALETLRPDDLFLVPTIDLEGISRQVCAYLGGSISRQVLSQWARELLLVDNEDRIFFAPESKSADLYQAISLIEGFDLRHGGPEEPFLYTDEQLVEWVRELERGFRPQPSPRSES